MSDLDPIEAALSEKQREAWRACRAPGDMPVREFARFRDVSPGTVSNHLRRAENNLADAADQFADAATTVDFDTESQLRSTSWERADKATRRENLDSGTDIESVNRFAWTVRLPNGQTHVTALLRSEDVYKGWCDCDGHTYRDPRTSPCAHLCTLRQANFVHAETAEGDRVTIPEQPPRTPATDGGQPIDPAAGHDGREFGRPETQL